MLQAVPQFGLPLTIRKGQGTQAMEGLLSSYFANVSGSSMTPRGPGWQRPELQDPAHNRQVNSKAVHGICVEVRFGLHRDRSMIGGLFGGTWLRARTEKVGRTALWMVVLLAICGSATAQTQSPPPSTPSSTGVALTITGDINKPLSLSLTDLQRLPRTTLKVINSHEGKEEVYEGVLLGELLKRAGLPQGENLRGSLMASYLLVQASDGYRVVLSLAERDFSFQNSEILVADRMNGQVIGSGAGPRRLILPHDLRPGRWVRMLNLVRVVTVSNEPSR